jgi:hypothetical protein
VRTSPDATLEDSIASLGQLKTCVSGMTSQCRQTDRSSRLSRMRCPIINSAPQTEQRLKADEISSGFRSLALDWSARQFRNSGSYKFIKCFKAEYVLQAGRIQISTFPRMQPGHMKESVNELKQLFSGILRLHQEKASACGAATQASLLPEAGTSCLRGHSEKADARFGDPARPIA